MCFAMFWACCLLLPQTMTVLFCLQRWKKPGTSKRNVLLSVTASLKLQVSSSAKAKHGSKMGDFISTVCIHYKKKRSISVIAVSMESIGVVNL